MLDIITVGLVCIWNVRVVQMKYKNGIKKNLATFTYAIMYLA